MEMIFTDHAKQRMIERKITISEVKSTVDLPDYTVSKNNKIESHKRIGEKTLKVVYVKMPKFIKIITLMWK